MAENGTGTNPLADMVSEIIAGTEVVSARIEDGGVHFVTATQAAIVDKYGSATIEVVLRDCLLRGSAVMQTANGKVCRWCGVNPVDDLRTRCAECAAAV